MNRLLAVAGLAALLLGVAGCNSSTNGQANPAAGPTSAATPSEGGGGGASTSAGAPGGGGSLPVKQPCSLLSPSALQQLGSTDQPTQDEVGGEPDCSADLSNGNLGVTILSDHGLSQLNVQGQVTDQTVGGHPAKQMLYTSDASDCLVAIEVSATSRVDVSFEADGGVDPCSIAMKAAQLVAPGLPAAG